MIHVEVDDDRLALDRVRDADRSGLDETELALRVIEHMRPLDPAQVVQCANAPAALSTLLSSSVQLLVADIAHIAGLIAGGAHPSPVAIADVVSTTTPGKVGIPEDK